jgi:hypothetical protein
MTAVRQEVLGYIDELPDAKLETLRPLLKLLAEDGPLVIETDLTDEEKAHIAAGMKEYDEQPESFIPLEAVDVYLE